MKNYTNKTIEYYDSHLENYIKIGGAVVLEGKIKKFIEILPGKRVIDVACGPGHDTDYMVGQGIDCTGVDLSNSMIDYAKKNCRGKFRVMDFFNLESDDNCFDGMWCSSIFVHIKRSDVSNILKISHAKLKKDGVLGIITAQKQKKKRMEDDTRQYTMYGKKELEGYLQQAGFEILHSESFVYGHQKRLYILSKKIY